MKNPIFGESDNGSAITDYDDRFEYLKDQGWSTMQIWWLFVAEETRAKEQAATHWDSPADPEEDEHVDQDVYDLTADGYV